jgi:cytochrome P450
LITRRSLAPDVLDGVEVPADALVIVSPWVLHRDPACWEEPERFRPERFLGAAGAVAGRSAAYLPFGAGPRLCIGREVALLESVVSLAGLARRYDLLPTGSRPPRPLAQVTVRPENGLPVRLALRT